jgi:coenzyme F420-dependent glucose-6-phosphate dehydrogenase
LLTLGYKASAEQFDARTLVEFGVEAEQAGFDSVVVSDHFQPWRHTNGHAPYSFAWLAALGERTKKVRLGTSVVTPTFRYNPAIVAQAMGTLGVLYPGRLLLGVGTGESMNEVPVLGITWPGFRERFDRLVEAVDLMRELLDHESVTFEGKYFHTRNATVYERPAQKIPILIAGTGGQAATLAGKSADGFICTSGKGTSLYVDTLLPAVQKGAQEAGRDASKLELMMEVKVSYDKDKQQALENTRVWAALALPPESKTGIEDPRELERLAAELPLEKAASRWLVSSDPDEHVEQIKQYVDMGFKHLVFHAPGDDQRRFIDAFGADVLPRLRKLG